MELTNVKIHSTILFEILDGYERRKENSNRVVGTLLGKVHGSEVTITSCFPVNHSDNKDNVQLDMSYARKRAELELKAKPHEAIVGWFSTGTEIVPQSTVIDEYYIMECKRPIHLLINTELKEGTHMTIKTFISGTMGVPSGNCGSIYEHIENEIVYHDAERVALDFIAKGSDKSYAMNEDKYKTKTSIKMPDMMETSVDNIDNFKTTISFVTSYVQKVVDGELPMDSEVGRKLWNSLKMVPFVEEQNFSKMLTTNINDILQVRMLAKALKAQTSLNELLVNTSAATTAFH